jgi:hypothetical protein
MISARFWGLLLISAFMKSIRRWLYLGFRGHSHGSEKLEYLPGNF